MPGLSPPSLLLERLSPPPPWLDPSLSISEDSEVPGIVPITTHRCQGWITGTRGGLQRTSAGLCPASEPPVLDWHRDVALPFPLQSADVRFVSPQSGDCCKAATMHVRARSYTQGRVPLVALRVPAQVDGPRRCPDG